jgi:segregation and condensation protein B
MDSEKNVNDLDSQNGDNTKNTYITKFESQIEAVLFVSGTPVQFERLCEIFSLSPQEMLCELKSLEKIKSKSKSGLCLIKVDGAYQLCTKQETSEYVKRFLEMKKAPPLSKAALEVLAITAYHQPVTRSFIEHVRGIESSSIVAGLEEKGLISECGHLDAPGRPALFMTTEAFLRSFGLESIDSLPVLPEEYSLDNGQMSLDLEEKDENNDTSVDTQNNSEEVITTEADDESVTDANADNSDDNNVDSVNDGTDFSSNDESDSTIDKES